MDLGAPELLIILVIGLLVFGSSRLPKLARSLGQAAKEFKQGVDDMHEGLTPKPSDPPKPPTPEGS